MHACVYVKRPSASIQETRIQSRCVCISTYMVLLSIGLIGCLSHEQKETFPEKGGQRAASSDRKATRLHVHEIDAPRSVHVRRRGVCTACSSCKTATTRSGWSCIQRGLGRLTTCLIPRRRLFLHHQEEACGLPRNRPGELQ